MSSGATYPVGTIAKLLMLTERRVQQLTAEGVIPKPERARYELVPAVQGYVKYLRARTLGVEALDGAPDMVSDKARLLKAKADISVLEVERARGDLLPAEEVVAGWETAIGRTRSLLLGIPTSAAQTVVLLAKSHEGDAEGAERAVREHLRKLIDGACDELVNTSLDDEVNDEAGVAAAA